MTTTVLGVPLPPHRMLVDLVENGQQARSYSEQYAVTYALAVAASKDEGRERGSLGDDALPAGTRPGWRELCGCEHCQAAEEKYLAAIAAKEKGNG